MEVALSFRVSRDEEHVEVTAQVGSVTHELRPRAHHYLLLTLARARLRDQDTAEGEQGWLTTAELLKMLRQTPNQRYLSVHRLRKDFEGMGLPAGFEPIERRSLSHQLRIGTPRLHVEAP